MIDHASVPVRSLAAATSFYEAILGPLGYGLLVAEAHRVGFGKRYPELWLNERPDMHPAGPGSGHHLCLRAGNSGQVDAFYAAALAGGGRDGGAPGARRYSQADVYAAFIVDSDGNRIEAMTILPADASG